MTTFSTSSHPGPLMDYRVVERWFVLGSERGTYDAPAPDVREVPTPTLDHWLAQDGVRVVRDAAAFLAAGRVLRPDPAIHVLARAIIHGPVAAREEALAALPTCLKSGAHLFRLLRYIRGRTAWNGAVREAIGAWYAGRSTLELAVEVVRTPADRAWNHREAFLLGRPEAHHEAQEAFFRWLVEGKLARNAGDDPGLELLAAFTRLQETSAPLVARSLVGRWPILRDALPAPWLEDAGMVEGIVETLSGEGLMTWVGRLAAHDALRADAPGAVALARRVAVLEPTARAGIAPFAALTAWSTTRILAARGATPPPGLQEALYELFHDRVATLPRGRAPLVVAVDPAASTALDGLPGCPGLDPRTAIAAMALVATASSERVQACTFGRGLEPLELGRGDDLRTLLARLDRVRAGTIEACAPIEHAYGEAPDVATFLVLGGTRPTARPTAPEDVLLRYRKATGVPSRWIGVSLGQHRLAPRPPISLDALEIHGFDATVPVLLGELLHPVST